MTSNYAEQARARKLADALSCGIDDAFISRLVDSFYDSIRQDDMLGPIFAERIGDWPHHLARMKDFWASIMLESGRFSGNPMRKHIAIGKLDEAHFVRWRSLWDQTLCRIAPSGAVADKFREAAQRIGESLLAGIRIDRGDLGAISAKERHDARSLYRLTDLP
ncbi:MAG: group III truncated hemoglobin [Sphingomonas sp.]|jgi:hemoglobin